MDDFADRLKQLREARGLAVEEAANMQTPRTTGRTWWKWENRREEPKLERFRSLCRFFGVSGNYLLGWPEGAPPPKIDVDAGSVPAGVSSEAAEEVAEAVAGRKASPRPKSKPRRSTRRPES